MHPTHFCVIRPSLRLRLFTTKFRSLRLRLFTTKFRFLCSRLRWLIRKPKLFIKKVRLLKVRPKDHVHLDDQRHAERPIRIATFNVAMFSLAPAISKHDKEEEEEEYFSFASPIKSPNYIPRSILKQSPLRGSGYNTPLEDPSRLLTRTIRKVSINLPDNEISVARRNEKRRVPARSPVCYPCSSGRVRSRSIVEVMRDVDADVWALQDVKAEQERGMKPLSDLATFLNMNYVFAESWAPEYGNAILSKWPIKSWKLLKIADHTDFRNVLKATIDVPWIGEFNFQCTQLDHLNENWRMKQINAIIRSNDYPHILAGGLNSLNGSDYSSQRWTDIVKYYEDIGKPTPKTEVMRFVKAKEYTDAKEFAGECEPVVIIAKGQNVQGTCKYGTRVDYILASRNSTYKFVPGSYSVVSSKGTSDHHIVKVDMVKKRSEESVMRQMGKPKKKVMNNTCYFSRGIWKIDT